MKKVIKMALFGILLGSSIFAIIGLFFDISNHGNFVLANWSYTKMLTGGMLVGMGFSVPAAFIYNSEKLPSALKVLIHLGIGCTVLLIVAFSVGWIPVEAGWKICTLYVCGYLASAFLIWLSCFCYFRREAKRINEVIRKKQKDL